MSYARPAVTFHWRPTTDALRVHAIHSAVLAKTPPGMVRPDPLSHFELHTGVQGETLGCFLDTGEMIAYGVIGLHSDTVAHMADMLGAQAARFCVLDGAASLAQWRGFGLHNFAIEERIKHAVRLERTQVGATVAPENIRSVRGLLRSGLVIRGFARMYGGMARLLVSRDMLAAQALYRRESSVAMRDLDGHQDALAAGLVGYACTQDGAGDWAITYGG